MIAVESKFENVLLDRPQYANILKNSTNLDTSQSSSSDESLKSKSENEVLSDQSLDSSKYESSDDQRVLNDTYSCDQPDSTNEGKPDVTIEKDEEISNLTILKNADNTVEWKYSSTSYTQSLDITKWDDLNLDNLTIEDSIVSKDDPLMVRIRKYLADFQEHRGTSREEYTFATLIRVMGQATGRCLFALFYVILNIAPAVLEMFMHIVRFMLDKMIDIKNTTDVQQIVMKTTIFAAQVLCIYICLVFIFGFIVWPVIRMAIGILTKIMLYD